MRTTLLWLVALLAQTFFTGKYLAQAAWGQVAIWHAARPLEEAVADERIPERTRRLLAAVPAIKRYGRAQGLEPTRSYEQYADLGRPAAAWIVQGSEPLSFEVKRWRFPIVGSVPYLGFFDERGARRHAERLAAQEGLEVDVRTASAFSTLGWFRDPVLSTMIGGGDEALGDLANVVLHESVHATLYVKDQSAFNESLASYVADALTHDWLTTTLGAEAAGTRAWVASQERARARIDRLHRAYVELDAVYRSGAPDAQKLARKASLLEDVRAELGLARPLNNAALAGYRAYDSGGAAFGRLLSACGGSWPRFLRSLGALESSSFGRPQQDGFDEVVDGLARRGCAPAGERDLTPAPPSELRASASPPRA